ncbi:nicotianamine synthase family protein [Desulfospira joergensenii]|uniref:nicotianamine synthase family protein n=1 Tax=Desulfospira joergensenii TaxID=53329 RepID=UPI0003B72842|nr:nicotianamine synthase family protein [Desulfospira joergensenii]
MADLDLVKKEFLDIYASLSDVTETSLLNGIQAGSYPFFQRLDRMAAMDVDDREAEEIRRDKELRKAMAHICRLKRINGLRMEIDNARTIIQSPAPWEAVRQFVYYPNYLELARMESSGANLLSGDKVVFLGSGPLPLTLICLWTRYGIKGIGIEQCPEYADLSRQLIRGLGLAEEIRIIEGNHYCLPLAEDCSLIMIGADALPKDEIFSHLADRLEEGTKLSYRIYEKGLRRLLDVQSSFDLPAGFRQYRRIRPQPPVNNTSVFISKEGKAG